MIRVAKLQRGNTVKVEVILCSEGGVIHLVESMSPFHARRLATALNRRASVLDSIAAIRTGTDRRRATVADAPTHPA